MSYVYYNCAVNTHRRQSGPFPTHAAAEAHRNSYPNPSALRVSQCSEDSYEDRSDYAEVGETIQWTSGKGVHKGEVMFIHRDLPTGAPGRNADYYSIATGPNPMDRHFLNSNMMQMLKVVNLSAGQQLAMEF